MITSEQVDKIFPALIKAQSEMGNAKKSSANPFFKSKYADLSEIIEVSKDVLSANGIGIIQSPGGDGNTVTVTARLIHVSGQWIEDTISLPLTQNTPQAAGSAITYGRRYQLAALMNMAQEDDDGNTASEKPDPEFIKVKNALVDYLNAGVFNHPENVEKAIADKNLDNMKKALAVAKGKENK